MGYHFLCQGNLPGAGIEPESLPSPALVGRFFTTSATREFTSAVFTEGIREGGGTPSSALAWKIPRTGEPGGLRSTGSLRVEHDFTFTFTFHFHEMEKEMATDSSALAWRIPGTGEPGGLLSMGSHRVRHD